MEVFSQYLCQAQIVFMLCTNSESLFKYLFSKTDRSFNCLWAPEYMYKNVHFIFVLNWQKLDTQFPLNSRMDK